MSQDVNPRAAHLLARIGRLSPAALILLGLLLAWATQVSPRLQGAWRFGAGALGLCVGVVVLSAAASTQWWRSRTVWAWLAFWMVWVATLPWTLRPASMPTPDPIGAAREAQQVAAGLKYPIQVPPLSGGDEVTQLALAAAVTGAMLLLAGGTRRGVLAFRALWLAVLWSTAPVAIREVVADRHIITTKYDVWFFAPHTPAGPFQNPNNYACVLACAVGVLLVWVLDTSSRWWAGVLLASVALAAALEFTTGGRAALVAIVLQVLAALAVALRRRGLSGHASMGAGRSTWRRAVVVGAGVLVGSALVVLALVVPALTSRNPLTRLFATGDGDAAAYDSLRFDLTRTGLRYWWEHPWLGTGAGTFETRLATELPHDVSNQTINLHNAFVEILSQYGVVVFAPFALLLLVLAWRVVDKRPLRHRPPRSTRSRAPESPRSGVLVAESRGSAQGVRRANYRLELASLLMMIAVTGVVVSSALALPMWFVMIAHATHLGWALERR
ncbi:MAG: O-antigen ligase family protein [Dermatophilaceae bacterium]